MEEKRLNNGLLAVLAGALLWSTNGVIIKWVSVDAFLLMGIRSLIAGIMLLPFLRPKRIPLNRYTLLMLVSYPALCMGMVLALRSTSPPIAIATQYTAPIWIFLINRIGGMPYDRKELFSLGCLITGIVFFMSSNSSGITALGNLYALSTGVSFAVLTYTSKHVCDNNPIGAVSMLNLFTAIIIFVFFKDIREITAVPITEWPALIYLGVFQLGLGYALYYTGMRYTTPQRAAMITPVEIVMGPVWIMIFLHEYPDLFSAIGYIFIIASVVMEIMRSRNM